MSKVFEEEGRQSARMSRRAEDDGEMYGSGVNNNGPDPYDDADFHRTKRAGRTQEGKQGSAARSSRTKGNNGEFNMTGALPSLRAPPLHPDPAEPFDEARASRGSRRERAPDREQTLVSRVSQRGGTKHPDGAASRRDSQAPSQKKYGSVAQETGYLGKYHGLMDTRLPRGYEVDYLSDDGRSLCSEDERDIKMLKRRRATRERRNLPAGELYYKLDHAETDEEHRALAKEIERRRKVSKVVGFFGGHSSSEKKTRDMLVAAGWSRK